MFDLIISNGTIIDGSDSPSFNADIGIVSDRIKSIGDLSGYERKKNIDAKGFIVSPGFIDTHAHSDGVLLIDPQHANGIRQGITTEILGQDGLSYAPLSKENYKIYRKYLSGILGEPPEDLDMSSIKKFRSHYNEKVSINTAYPIAHGALRLEVLGFRDLPMRGKYLDKAKDLIVQGMSDGAIGLATGLSYHPQAWSDTEELIELCKVVKEYGGVYITHLRDVNIDRSYGGGNVAEALEIGRRSGVKVHFSHFRTAPNNPGKTDEILDPIDKAKKEGIDITLELYPYPTGSTFPMSFLPSPDHSGGIDEMKKLLNEQNSRNRIINYLNDKPLSDAVLTYVPKNISYEGMTILDISRSRKLSLGETLVELLDECDMQIGYLGAPPQNIKVWNQLSRDALKLLSRPDYMIGSDAIPLGSMPHPRAYGTFPRFLGRFRRNFGGVKLETLIQRVTQNPADRFGLKNRGLIKEGYFADITIFDSEKFIDNSTYDDPKQFPSGIPFVIVNGQIAVDQEVCTGIFAGRAIP
ncbi:MAG: hypothetical protein CL758_08230 [Chloroflexi bacterium]|nr:hypothetical protein [Chloroflexota bacterium]|tara:strand:+ start:24934 stop:26505 length:1572 start_codon:yes stop_codon:yes gene_type:complete